MLYGRSALHRLGTLLFGIAPGQGRLGFRSPVWSAPSASTSHPTQPDALHKDSGVSYPVLRPPPHLENLAPYCHFSDAAAGGTAAFADVAAARLAHLRSAGKAER